MNTQQNTAIDTYLLNYVRQLQSQPSVTIHGLAFRDSIRHSPAPMDVEMSVLVDGYGSVSLLAQIYAKYLDRGGVYPAIIVTSPQLNMNGYVNYDAVFLFLNDASSWVATVLDNQGVDQGTVSQDTDMPLETGYNSHMNTKHPTRVDLSLIPLVHSLKEQRDNVIESVSFRDCVDDPFAPMDVELTVWIEGRGNITLTAHIAIRTLDNGHNITLVSVSSRLLKIKLIHLGSGSVPLFFSNTAQWVANSYAVRLDNILPYYEGMTLEKYVQYCDETDDAPLPDDKMYFFQYGRGQKVNYV